MADLFRKTKSLYASTANTFGSGTGVTITPASVSGLPTDTEITLTFDRVDSSGTATPSAMERIIGTISGGNFVVRTSPSSGRGADGTSDAAHTSPVVEYIPNAADINDTVDGILAEHTQAGLHDVSAMIIGGSVIDEDSMATNSATKIPTQQSVKAYVDAQVATAGSTNGWTSSGDTWTYASATTFTISGVDRTTTFTTGTRLKMTQTSAKYFIVVSSSFSTNTTVTVTGGSDYTIANAAITSPFYSYEANPQGYPGWFNYSPTKTGWSSDTGLIQFSVVGRSCTVLSSENFGGTSNATTKTITLPITAVAFSATDRSWLSGPVQDNTAWQTAPGHIRLESADLTLVKLGKTVHIGAWTGSGSATMAVFFTYQI